MDVPPVSDRIETRFGIITEGVVPDAPPSPVSEAASPEQAGWKKSANLQIERVAADQARLNRRLMVVAAVVSGTAAYMAIKGCFRGRRP